MMDQNTPGRKPEVIGWSDVFRAPMIRETLPDGTERERVDWDPHTGLSGPELREWLRDGLGGPAKPDRPPKGADGLTEDHRKLILALADAKGVLKKDKLRRQTDVAERTQTALLTELLARKLIHQPHGSKRGWTITDRGRDAADWFR